MELAEHGLELVGTWLPGKSQDSSIPSTLVVKAVTQPLAKEGQSQGDGSSLAITAGLWGHVPKNREGPGQASPSGMLPSTGVARLGENGLCSLLIFCFLLPVAIPHHLWKEGTG